MRQMTGNFDEMLNHSFNPSKSTVLLKVFLLSVFFFSLFFKALSFHECQMYATMGSGQRERQQTVAALREQEKNAAEKKAQHF